MNQNVTVINAGAAVTPLNLRSWLRKELARQQYSGARSGGVEAYVFVTRGFITALGRKKLDKIISDAVSRHRWIVDAQVVTTSEPVSDEDAKAYIEEEEFEGSPQADGAEFGLLLLGFAQGFEPGIRLTDVLEAPVCVIRPIIQADVARIAKDGDNLPYIEGDFAVVGTVDDKTQFSDPFKTLEAAKVFASATYGVVQFFETTGAI